MKQSTQELIDKIKELVKQINEKLSLDAEFDVFADDKEAIVIFGTDQFNIIPEHIDDYLKLRLQRFELLLNPPKDLDEFVHKNNELTFESMSYYVGE